MEEKKKWIITGVKTIVVILVIVGLYIFLNNNASDGILWDGYVSTDIKYANGEFKSFDNNEYPAVDKGDTVTLRVNLPAENKVENSILCFYVYSVTIDAYFDGESIYTYGHEIDEKGNMIGACYPQIAIPDEAWGRSLDVVLNVRENQAFSIISPFKIYPAADAYNYYMDRAPYALFICITTSIAALIFLAILFIFFKNQGFIRRGIFIVFFALDMSIWIFTSFGISHILNEAHYWTWLEYLSLYILPIPLMLYLLESDGNPKIKKLLKYMAAIDSAFCVVATVLNFTNIVHYCNVLMFAHLLILTSALLMFVYIIIQIKKSLKSNNLLFLGMLILICVGIADILRFNAAKIVPDLAKALSTSIFPEGLLLFLVCLILSYYQELENDKERSLNLRNDLETRNTLIASIPTGVCVFNLDEIATIIEANNMFYEIFGYTKHDAEEEGFNYLLYPVLPEFQEAIVRFGARKIKAGKYNYEQEMTATHRSGRIINLLMRCYKNPDENYIIASIIDISERKEMETRLQFLQQEAQIAISLSDRQVLTYDISTETAYHRFHTKDLIGIDKRIPNVLDVMFMREMIYPDDGANLMDFFSEINDGNKKGSTELRIRRSAGETFRWYGIDFFTIYDNSGQATRAVISISDITEKKEQELAMEVRRQNLVSQSPEKKSYYEFNLTADKCNFVWGDWAAEAADEEDFNWEALRKDDIANVYPDDRATVMHLLDKENLIKSYHRGQTSFETDYREVRENICWSRVSITLLQAPFSQDILAFIYNEVLPDDQADLIQMKQNVDDMQHQVKQGQARLMISQMQPHFMYNALSAIRAIIKMDPDYAYDLLYDFSVHLRASVKAMSSDEMIPFEDELANIKAYLNIEQMRQRDKLKVVYDIQTTSFNVTPLSIQPIAENAARHGVFEKGREGGTVTVRTYENEQDYVVEVEDDGNGFDVEDVLKNKPESFGLKNLSYRLETLMHAKLNIDSQIGKGTKVTVLIPKNPEELK